ncbi:MAG: hypothetical protein RBS36_03785 [Thiomicrospira sp.]|jgi:hypothetical protein|nr:hypothetical protein [Thiomicrospira sp.]
MSLNLKPMWSMNISRFQILSSLKTSRVVIETDDAPKARQRLSAIAVDTRGFKFNCDEANKR